MHQETQTLTLYTARSLEIWKRSNQGLSVTVQSFQNVLVPKHLIELTLPFPMSRHFDTSCPDSHWRIPRSSTDFPTDVNVVVHVPNFRVLLAQMFNGPNFTSTTCALPCCNRNVNEVLFPRPKILNKLRIPFRMGVRQNEHCHWNRKGSQIGQTFTNRVQNVVPVPARAQSLELSTHCVTHLMPIQGYNKAFELVSHLWVATDTVPFKQCVIDQLLLLSLLLLMGSHKQRITSRDAWS